jgi:hypothetical protein
MRMDGLPRRAFGTREVAEQRGDVRELERVPASLRIQLEGALEGVRRVGESAGADEMGARQRRMRGAVAGVELEGPADRLEPFLLDRSGCHPPSRSSPPRRTPRPSGAP